MLKGLYFKGQLIMNAFTYPRVSVGIIVIDKGHILLGKRINSHGSGTWALPGGHLEYGEDIEECAQRELHEETGLEALALKKGPWMNHKIEEKHYVSIFMYVTAFQGILTLKEPEKCERWEWFPLQELPSPLFTPLERFIQNHAFEHKDFGYAYLSCPYFHADPEVKKKRVEEATKAAHALFKKGISVFSPLTHNHPIAESGVGTGWDKWEGFDLGMVSRAQKLYVLTIPGWEASFGIQAEMKRAKELNIPIEMINIEDL